MPQRVYRAGGPRGTYAASTESFRFRCARRLVLHIIIVIVIVMVIVTIIIIIMIMIMIM